MGRGLKAILGLGAVALAAVFVAKTYLRPAKEGAERKRSVLTHAYAPRVEQVYILQEPEIEELGLEALPVGDQALYLGVQVLYPQAVRVPDPGRHALGAVNGAAGERREPVHRRSWVDPEGAHLLLVFKVDETFEQARLLRGARVIAERVAPR